MPRMQPPPGYLTATDVKKLLNISDAMIRVHVQKGRIKYVTPSGRKQGFYLQKDVEKLANDLNIFLSLDDEASTKFTQATQEDLPEILEIAKALFGGGSNGSSLTPLERRVAWLRKNPDVYHTLRVEDQIVGYAAILPLKEDTDKLGQLLKADFAGQVNVTPDDIEDFKPGRRTHIYIVSIGIKPNIRRSERRMYAFRLISGLMDMIVGLGRKGVIVETMAAIGQTSEGIRLLQHFGFSEIVPPTPGKRAFTINIKESGAPVILQYKQALTESGYQL